MEISSPDINEVTASQSAKSFDEQFHTFEKIEIGDNKKVTAIDIIPKNPIGNPVGYFLGWGGQIEGCGPFFEGFYENDKRVIANQYPTYLPELRNKPEGFSHYGFRNALAFVETIKQKGLTRVDLVGHSEGAGIALMANLLLQEEGIEVGSIVLVNPSGIENFGFIDGIRRLKAMLGGEGKRAKTNPELAALNKENNKYALNLLKHPLNTALEGLNVGHMDMPHLIAEAIRRGQKIGIIQAANDPFVPYEELGPGIAKAQQEHRIHAVDQALKELPHILRDAVEQEKLVTKATELNRQEMQNPLMISIPKEEDAGHLFNGFYPKNPYFYVSLVTQVQDYFETGELSKAA